jgi:glycosyltransferase involved in cell wall biosynthesis
MDLSVVIPVRNEAPNLAPLVAEIRTALDGHFDYEIVYVDDGSSDGTADELARLRRDCERLSVVRHRRSYGQSMAIRSGVKAAHGAWIATLDGDGQNDPGDIPMLWEIAQREPADAVLLVAGQRRRRRDSWSKRWASRTANAIRQAMLRDRTADSGCGLKLFRRDMFLDLPAFDHMHRFLPALVLGRGGKVISVPVNHRPRQRGRSNYGVLDRAWVGLVDLFGVMWLLRRMKNPELALDDR